MQGSNVTDRDPGYRPEPSADDVRAELEHVLSSPHLEASERRRAFLRFIVGETLEGRADRLKGYTIAVTLFGRDASFDPQSDPVVRLEARRLRRDLDSYYVEAGSHDRVRITIPKGSYVPHFEWGDEAPSSRVPTAGHKAGPGGRPANALSRLLDAFPGSGSAPAGNLLAGGLLVLLAAIALTGWLLKPENPTSISVDYVHEPAVVVSTFEALSSTEDTRYLAKGISLELVRNLMRFSGLRLYSPPASRAGQEDRDPVKMGSDLGVAYVVTGSVRIEADDIRVSAQVVDATNGHVLWSETYDRPLTLSALFRVEEDLAGEIATVLGQPYGVLSADLKDRLVAPEVSDMQSYICVLRAYTYRRDFAREQFDPVLRCLEQAVRRDPGYSDAWAMLGWLHVDAGRIPYPGYGSTQEEFDKGLQSASRAVELEPNNILAVKALSAVNHYLGRYDESERLARQALELNPYDPETLAHLGWRLAVRGNFDEGIPFLKRAIARSVNPPNWYFHLIAIDLCLRGDHKQMLRIAQRSADERRGFSQALIAVAAAENGDRELARQALTKMWADETFARDPAGYMRRHGAIDKIVETIMAGLENARRIASSS